MKSTLDGLLSKFISRRKEVMLHVRLSEYTHTHRHRCTSPTVQQGTNRKDMQLCLLLTAKSFGELLMENNDIEFVCTQKPCF